MKKKRFGAAALVKPTFNNSEIEVEFDVVLEVGVEVEVEVKGVVEVEVEVEVKVEVDVEKGLANVVVAEIIRSVFPFRLYFHNCQLVGS